MLVAMSRPLEPDRATRQRWLDAAARLVQDHLDGLAEAPNAGPIGARGVRRAAELSRPIGEAPLAGGLEEALDVAMGAIDASLNTASPRHFSHVPGGGLFAATLAELLTKTTNRYTGVAHAAPGLARLEQDVIDWLCRELRLGDDALGLLTSGGSLASFTAIVTARHERLGEDFDLRRATAYTSEQAHHCIEKCTRLAGIPLGNLRAVPVDDSLRMRVDALAKLVARDRADGLTPFLVVSAAGTTNTGAIDPLAAIADFCDAERLWHHADAAYGGAFVLCEDGRRRLAGLERADTVALDPHKGLFMPYGTGALLARDGAALARAHAAGASYLQDFESWDREGLAPSPADLGPELSRDARGLRLWLALQLHGVAAFRLALEEKLALAAELEREIERRIEEGAPLEIPQRAQLSVVTLRLRRRDGEALDAWNRRNARLLDDVTDRQRVVVSTTSLPVEDGVAVTLRPCILSFRTHAEHVAHFLEDLDASLAALAREGVA